MLRDKNGLTEQEFLEQYQVTDYERPSVASDMVIFTISDILEANYRKLPDRKLSILLIKRGQHPFLGCWALPGGFVRPNETAGQTARRELFEETGVDHAYLEQLGLFSNPNRDPRTWVMSCAHMALIDSSACTLRAGDDAAQTAWFQLDWALLREYRELQPGGVESLEQQFELKCSFEDTALSAVIAKKIECGACSAPPGYEIIQNNGLAFDHAKIILCALDRLRLELNTTDIAFHLMPPLFTLTQLQQVYEVILGRELLKAAFRRKISPLVEETNHFTQNAGHRPSRLFRRKPPMRIMEENHDL